MLSKCANPECFNQFRYLHRGIVFHLTPTLELEAAGACALESLHERFWLCHHCCKQMNLVWDGVQVKVVPLHNQPAMMPSPATENGNIRNISEGRASAGGHIR
jgi:hypothetical protein